MHHNKISHPLYCLSLLPSSLFESSVVELYTVYRHLLYRISAVISVPPANSCDCSATAIIACSDTTSRYSSLPSLFTYLSKILFIVAAVCHQSFLSSTPTIVCTCIAMPGYKIWHPLKFRNLDHLLSLKLMLSAICVL